MTLLSVVCIGGAELIVCRFMDPALYERITAPVRAAAAELGDTIHTTLEALKPTPEPTPQPTQEPLEEQSAGAPAVVSTLTLADPAVTRLETRGDQEILTGGNSEIIYYNQSDEKWYSQPYGSDFIGKYGCGPTAMAMAVSSLTETDIDPTAMAQWAAEQGYCARRSGSYRSIVQGTAEAYGLTAEPLAELDVQRLRQELASGKLLVALMTRGHFTENGHFILLRGVTLEGDILVADPNSRDRSLTVWDAQLILDELSPARSDGAPLWLLSPAPAPVG